MKLKTLYNAEWQPFSVKDQIIVNTLGFMGHIRFCLTVQLCLYSIKAAMDNSQMKELGCVQIKLYKNRLHAGFGFKAIISQPSDLIDRDKEYAL